MNSLRRIKNQLLARYLRWKESRPVIGFSNGAYGKLTKRALMTYTVRPFHLDAGSPAWVCQSNLWESVEIVRIFNRLGYVVDIVDYKDTQWAPTKNYDVFFGMHENFERLMPYLDTPIPKIYYATGAHWSWENIAEQERVEALRRRKGIDYPPLPKRQREHHWAEMADAVIALGNEWTRSTYFAYNRHSYGVKISVVPIQDIDLSKKDFSSARRNFLWMSGVGLLHKGLDLLLDVFSELPDLELYLCGSLEGENDFVKVYERELFHTANIHWIGWVNVRSDQFRRLVDQCAYITFISCSEGGGGSVLTCMQCGLVPIVSKESSVDTGNYGITLSNNSLKTIYEVVREASQMPIDVCRKMAEDTQKEIRLYYSREAFSKNMEQILRTILGQPKA
jgi:glycosyltransferase involved in cell wall biosynthesis